MKEFKQAKEDYDRTPIPPELGARVEAGIRQGREKRRQRQKRLVRRWVGAAACFGVLLAGLNLSPTLARAAAEVPVLGGLFRVLTVARYEASGEGIHYDVSVPNVDSGASLAQEVNAAIQEKVDQHMARARQDWADYQEAFFATGGTEEEWAGREMDVIIDYEIKSQTDTQVSFCVTLAEGWVASMEERCYYNLDLAEDRAITLEDILGPDWVSLCNAAVSEQIAASVDEEGFTYFFSPEEGGFTTVDEATSFYVRPDGTVVLVFPKYAIAAGAAGFPEFPLS